MATTAFGRRGRQDEWLRRRTVVRNSLGGTATGVAWLTSELFPKRLEIMRELVPTRTVMGILINPNAPEAKPQLQDATLKELATEQSELGELWKKASNEQLNSALEKAVQAAVFWVEKGIEASMNQYNA